MSDICCQNEIILDHFIHEFFYYFLTRGISGGSTYTKVTDSFDSAPYSGRSSSIKPPCDKTIKSLHHDGNLLKQKQRCSNIPGCLHQSLAQLAQELKSIPVDWAVGLHGNGDEFTLWWESNILDHLVRCRQLGCSEKNLPIPQLCNTPSHPYERPARAPQNQCQPTWAISVETAKARWFHIVIIIFLNCPR